MPVLFPWPRRRRRAPNFLALAALASGGCYVGVESPDALSASASAGLSQSGTDGTGEGSESGESGDATGDATGDGDGPPPELDPAPATLRLLLRRHYTNSVRDLLGDAAAAVVTPPEDTPLNGFDSVGASQFALTDAQVEAYEGSARKAAAAAMSDVGRIAALLNCQPSGPADSECHASFVRNFGRLAWRRPLEGDEVDRYVAVAQEAALGSGDFYVGVENTIAALLQSPYFLYKVEIGELDPEDPSRRLLTGVEMATRISYFLVDTTPSPALLDAAEDGMLDSADGIREVATAMLADPAVRLSIDAYFAELLRLRALDTVVKSGDVWPQWSPALAQAMRSETLMLIDDIIWQRDADLREILDAPYTFANDLIGPLYGLQAPGGAWGDGFVKVPLPPESKRGGILGQGSILSVFAHIGSTSPTLRGKFVRETLMCESIPAPPPGVSMVIPPEGEAAPTMRERLQLHLTDDNCAACHLAMDPIGFGLENYDGIGVFRTTENGVTIDTASEIGGLGAFDGARELGGLLKARKSVNFCTVRNLFRHATGHIEVSGEVATLLALSETYADHGYRMQDLLVELVANPTFRMVGAPE